MAKVSKLKCTCCGKEKAETTGFYLSQSPLYKHNEGRMTVCKECLFEKYKELSLRYNNEEKALYHLCMMLDIYFSKDLVDSAYKQGNRKNSEKGLLMTYITKLNSLPQYKGMGSFESDYVVLDENVIRELEDKYKVEIKEENIESKEKIVTSEIKKRWGRVYSDEDCLELEDFYDEYFNNLNHENDYMKLDIIKEMCTFKLIISQAKREKDNKTVREFSSLISSKMADANLKPSQQKILGEADDDIFGMKLYVYEKKKPIPKPLKEYLDVDKFWKYILKHMIKPMSVAMGLGQGDYSLEDGDKDIQLDDKMQKALEDSITHEG